MEGPGEIAEMRRLGFRSQDDDEWIDARLLHDHS
jgi:hypothetical protein